MNVGAAPCARRPRLWPGLLAALLLVMLLVVLQWQQQRQLDRSSSTRQGLQQALADLDAGSLHFALGQGGDTPWNRAQGRALLQQGLSQLQQVQAGLVMQPDLRQRLQRAVPDLQTLLVPDDTPADPVAARLALHAAVSAAHELARHVEQEREQLQQSQTQAFRSVAALAALALVGIGWGLQRALQGRSQAERDLQASEQRLRQLTESLPLVIWTSQPDGDCDYVSPCWRAWTGRDDSAASGQGWLHAVHADDRALVQSAWQRARDLSIDFQAEFRLLRSDGGALWVASRATRLRDAQGRTLKWFGAHTDVTDLRRARAEANAATSLVAATLESTDNGILVSDQSGRIVVWNRRLLQVPGLPETLLREGDRDQVLACIAGQARQPQAVLDALQVPDEGQVSKAPLDWADGRSIELRSAPLRVGLDTVGRVLSFRDVTARQRALQGTAQRAEELDHLVRARTAALERAMAERSESESFIRTVTDNLPLLLSYWTREGRCDFANRPCHDALGLGPGQLIGQMRDQVPADSPLAPDCPLMDAALQGRMQSFERTAPGADGQARHLWTLYVPHRREHDVVGIFVVVTDITPLKRTQQQLQQLNQQLVAARDAAQAANDAKSDFLATISHEIRTPMNVVLSLARRLRADLAQGGQREQIDRIHGAAQHLLTIVNDVLDLSKIEAGHVALQPAGFALPSVLDAVRALVIDDARAKGLDVLTAIDGVPERLRGDATRLRQALLNYAANAVKFTERGQVLLRVRQLQRDGSRLLLRFEVVDSGPGIEPDQVERLFGAYQQADAGTAGRHGGTGLGLAITRRLATLMRGQSGADSQPGRGSTFWFTAWLEDWDSDTRAPAPADAQGSLSDAQLRQRHAGARVLVAEDHPVNQEIACQLLQSAGLQVDVVGDGEAAVQCLQQQAYDLVLMDMQMPRMDGPTAARHIRALPTGGQLPIVAMTANAFAEDRAACLAAGMNDFVAKPVEPETLYAVLSRWLDLRLAPQAGAASGPTPAAPAIEGIDPGRLQRLQLSKAGLPCELLRRFARHHQDDLAWLQGAQADRAELSRRVHAVKGSALAVGALEVHRLALALDGRLRAGETVDAVARDRAALAQTLADLIQRIERSA